MMWIHYTYNCFKHITVFNFDHDGRQLKNRKSHLYLYFTMRHKCTIYASLTFRTKSLRTKKIKKALKHFHNIVYSSILFEMHQIPLFLPTSL